MNLMQTYETRLTDGEREAVEAALNVLRDDMAFFGVKLKNDGRAAIAAEALAVYIVESRA